MCYHHRCTLHQYNKLNSTHRYQCARSPQQAATINRRSPYAKSHSHHTQIQIFKLSEYSRKGILYFVFILLFVVRYIVVCLHKHESRPALRLEEANDCLRKRHFYFRAAPISPRALGNDRAEDDMNYAGLFQGNYQNLKKTNSLRGEFCGTISPRNTAPWSFGRIHIHIYTTPLEATRYRPAET